MPHRPMPRLFVVRHGQTEWSVNGRHTGISDIPLTDRGVEQVKATAQKLVGEGKLIDPKNLCTVFVSPRQRAHKTFHLLFENAEKVPDHILTEEAREWDYGDFEGLLAQEILERRPGWNAWKDGFPGGESVGEMESRVDHIIQQIRAYHRKYFEEGTVSRDVMIVAHGHFGRVLTTRWIGLPLDQGTKLTMDAGAITILSYNHNTLDEPSITALNLSSLLL
ncbi:phosphoglycerate mutase-like protein [Macrolepiota fuliginosa MF-IS2]|uniref:Phosphoglycerate mutase-like protein n=1 Tax=Macrolepiota fuliginosa MF-IS2 TaxID=1400762 RepID=A0A9P5XQI1_9AGAR|nr:phosphoglycerate mutase-like protein [Macrolepiota fuliginosa MF-IS2]